MDQRIEELKRLKKEYKRKKRKSIWVWDILADISFLLALLSGVILFVPLLPMVILVELLPEMAVGFIVEQVWMLYVIFGVSVLLFVLFEILIGCGKRRAKRSKEYLDYRTLKTTLLAEKREKK